MKPGTEKNLLQTQVGLAVVLLGLGLALGAVSIPSAAGYAGIGPNFLPWVGAGADSVWRLYGPRGPRRWLSQHG